MTNIRRRLLSVLLAASAVFGAWSETVTMHVPESFQVLSMSPNGKWACGAYIDATMNTYGFRWNLQSGEVEMLSYEPSLAYGVANDGTVSGEFPDKDATPYGVAVTMPGFWRDGTWHHLEVPAGASASGIGYGISPDGHYMTGSIEIGGIYTAMIWKDGAIHRVLNTGNHSVSMAVSPDGNGATGFATLYNRTACYWAPDGDVVYFLDSKEHSQSPWNYGRKFSPDGSKLLYWGGWEIDEADNVWLYSIYDLQTGEHIKVPSPAKDSDLEFNDISNSGMLVGADRGRGYVWTGETGYYIDDYLAARGADISSFDDFYGETDYYEGQLPIFNIISVSEDENILAVQYYNKRGQVSSMVIKMDQDLSAVAPVDVKGCQLNGLQTVGLKWVLPIGAKSIRGYNVYRDGVKINGFMPISADCYYDSKATVGTHTYQVAAVNLSGQETRAEEITVVVNDANNFTEMPRSLFTRQKGFNDATFVWEPPLSNRIHRHYYNINVEAFKEFCVYAPTEVEMAVKYDRAEIANYADFKIAEVSFVPLAAHESWTVSLYTRDDEGNLQLLASQPVTQALEYRKINTVKLQTPVDIPSGELIVAVSVVTDGDSYQVLGAEFGRTNVGYSDMLRQKSEPDFYSAFESSAAGGYSISALSWGIDIGLEPKTYNDADNQISHYNIYVDGELVGDTDRTTFVAEDFADGVYTVGVEAVYVSGSKSPVACEPLTISIDYPAVTDVNVEVGDDAQTGIVATWSAATDCDLTNISYSHATKQAYGIKGVESNGYALMAAAEYPATMFRGLEGYDIRSLRFYPLADALFTFILYENEELVCEIEIDDYNLGQWNEVELPEPLTIKENATYRLVLDCFDPEPDVELLGLDNEAAREFISDLYSIDNGETWSSVCTDTGATGNWMIGFTVSESESKVIPVDGYTVTIDSKIVTDGMLHEPCLVYDMPEWDRKLHMMRVDTYYPGRDDAVRGTTTTYRLSASGINDVEVPTIEISRGENYLQIDGDDVNGVQIVSIDGKVVAQTQGSRVEISHLPSGIYVVQIQLGANTVNRKVNIKN